MSDALCHVSVSFYVSLYSAHCHRRTTCDSQQLRQLEEDDGGAEPGVGGGRRHRRKRQNDGRGLRSPSGSGGGNGWLPFENMFAKKSTTNSSYGRKLSHVRFYEQSTYTYACPNISSHHQPSFWIVLFVNVKISLSAYKLVRESDSLMHLPVRIISLGLEGSFGR